MSVKEQIALSMIVIVGALIGACTTVTGQHRQAAPAQLPARANWVVLPIIDTSTGAFAGNNVQALLEVRLRDKGVESIKQQTPPMSLAMLQAKSDSGAKAKANYQYAVTGTVEQWGYDEQTGRNPQVSLALEIHDLENNTLAWQGRSSANGRAQVSLSSVADRLISDLLSPITIRASANSQVEPADSLPQNTPAFALPSALRGVAAGTEPDYTLAKDIEDLKGKSIAFYYAADPPLAILGQFDRVVLEPDNVKIHELIDFNQRGIQTYAYLSIGEVGPNRLYADSIEKGWVFGGNSAWSSHVMDLTQPGWRDFLLQRVTDLAERGYNGLFLDTLDSYQLVATTAAQRAQQERALVELLRIIKTQHPQINLIANRGFELLDQAAPYLQAVAAESLFASWDNTNQRYTTVSESDNRWLTDKLIAVKAQHGLDVIAIDYLPIADREQAHSVAARIAQLGFVPWVATPGLDSVGVGLLDVIPREVLLLYDSTVNGEQSLSEVHNLLATPLEYMGYVPVYIDLSKQALPQYELKGRFAGVAAWSDVDYQHTGLRDWIAKQLESKVPLAVFGNLGLQLDAELLVGMGISMGARIDEKTAVVTQRDELIGYETDLLPRLPPLQAYPRSSTESNQVHLQYSDASAQSVDMVVTGSWGGYALSPAVIDSKIDIEPYWIIDPFAFLRKALKLPSIPAPDITSENGKRLWFAHIDGDALPSIAEMPGKRLGAEVIEERILNRYGLPHTISIVEGEINDVPAYAKQRKQMLRVVKRLFARDDVEIASHTYSHPFRWGEIGPDTPAGKYNLPISDYRYSAQREVSGSVDYINKNLAPAGKQAKVMLWSGDALPTEQALAVASTNGLINMNGGHTIITRDFTALSLVSPMARTVGNQLQVYSPIMNENVFTNEWEGPFDGFRRVIETLELTDQPRRLKPANVYYHFYSGTKIAAIKALEEVYDWSSKQDIFPVFAGDYIRKVADFRRAGVARYLDGSWKISALGNVRSLRILEKNRWPKLAQAGAIVGVRQLHDGMYLHTNGADSVSFTLQDSPPTDFYLVSANGALRQWSASGDLVRFRLLGKVPVQMEIGGLGSAQCSVTVAGGQLSGTKTETGSVIFSFRSPDTGNAILNCRT